VESFRTAVGEQQISSLPNLHTMLFSDQTMGK